MGDIKKCPHCNGTGKAYSTVLRQYVVCDGCKGKGFIITG